MRNREHTVLLELKEVLSKVSKEYSSDYASADFIELIDDLRNGRSIDEIASEIDTKRGGR